MSLTSQGNRAAVAVDIRDLVENGQFGGLRADHVLARYAGYRWSDINCST